MQVILLPTEPIRMAMDHPVDVPVIRPVHVPTPPVVVPENLVFDDSQHADSKTAADVVGDSVLAGQYLGQLSARVERAWMRPRTEIGDPTFTCTAVVDQDGQGNVVSLALSPCNGSQRWRDSLVSAIRTASPLPAPPDPSVFRRTLRMVFRSSAYVVGGSTDGFEPPAMPPQLADNLPHADEQMSVTPTKTGVLISIVGHANSQPVQPDMNMPPQPSVEPAQDSP